MRDVKQETAWVLVEGEPFRSAALAYVKAYRECAKAWSVFSKTHGATAFVPNVGLCFNAARGAEWTAPRGRSKVSAPRKGSKAEADMKALPSPPKPEDVFGESLIYNVSYKGADVQGSAMIGFGRLLPRISFTTGDDSTVSIVAMIPHAGRAAENTFAAHGGAVEITTPNAVGWQIPQGLREVTEAEVELIFAQARVNAERAAA